MPIFSFSTLKLHTWYLKMRIKYNSLGCLPQQLPHMWSFWPQLCSSMSLHDSFFFLFSSITYFPSLSGPLWACCGLALTSRPYNYVVCGKRDGKDGICRHVCQQMSENVPSLALCTGNISDGREKKILFLFFYKFVWPLSCCQGSQAQCDLLCRCQLPHFLVPGGRFKFSTQMYLEVISLKISKMYLFSSFLYLSRLSGNFQLFLFIHPYSVFYHFKVSSNHKAMAQHNIAVAWIVTSSKQMLSR